MRISPALPRIPCSQPPTEADRAQAAAIADVLAGLIGDCDALLAALDADAAEAAHDGALRVARAIHAKSLQVRRDLEQLQAMEHRLVRRFFDTRCRLVGWSQFPSA
ncbi:hypothetical protein BH09ACT8_BH09ACT8_58540 [soil metagenome]